MLDTVWVLKKKSNGQKKARLNARGFKQVDGKFYDGSNISSPTVSEVSISVILTLALMATWAIHVVNIQGAFYMVNFVMVKSYSWKYQKDLWIGVPRTQCCY